MTDDGTRTVVTTVEGTVATVTLNRPEALNALNAAMFDELESDFKHLASSREVRVILIRGAGERAFAAGADIRELVETNGESGRAVSLRGQEVFRQIERCGKPVIACINGVALGGGCELALACTIRIASENAKLGLPEVKLGLIPGYGGTQRLPRLIGRSAALRLMLTAHIISATEALRLGMVDEIAPASELMGRAMSIAETIACMAPLAVAGILEAAISGTNVIDNGFDGEAGVFSRLCGTEDKHEGLTAFLEKRPAQWQGK